MMQKCRMKPNGVVPYYIFLVLAHMTLSIMLISNTLHIEHIYYLENNVLDIHRDYGLNNIPLLIMLPFILGLGAFFRPSKPIHTNIKRKKIDRSIKVRLHRFYYDIKSNTLSITFNAFGYVKKAIKIHRI